MGICCCAPQKAVDFKRSPDEPDSYIPSTLAMRAGSPAMKNFRELTVSKAYGGENKILVLCSSEFLLPCKNGKLFNTGHHTTETLVPIFHLDACGFKFDIATEEGKPVALEEWTFFLAKGYEDKIREVHTKLKDQLASPMKYEDIDLGLESYAGVFVPGGHGPLIKMPEMVSLGKVLRSAHEKMLPTCAICHGPAALAAGRLGGDFPYKGYKICMFPDKVDKMSPMFGYLPGQLEDKDRAEARMKALGVEVVNKEMDDSTYVHEELFTGASQAASQNLAEVFIKALAEKNDFKIE